MQLLSTLASVGCVLGCSLACAVDILKAQNIPTLAPDKFAQLDCDPKLSAQLGTDRISKWIVSKASKDADSQINDQFLRESISLVMEDGSFGEALCADLSKGDDALRNTVARTLYTYNFSEAQSANMIDTWAATGSDDNLTAIFGNAAHSDQILDLFAQYCLNVDSGWILGVDVTNKIISGRSIVPLEVLRQALVNTVGFEPRSASELVRGAQRGELKSKFAVAAQLPSLLGSNGSLARFIRSSPLPQDSLYKKIWDKVSARIAADPLLIQEYVRRSIGASVLYDDLRGILLGAIRRFGRDRLVPNFLRAAKIPQSRFEYIVKQVTPPRTTAFASSVPNDEVRARMSERLAELCEQKTAWTDFILWHLTRVGEAAAITSRSAILWATNDDEELARKLADKPALFGAAFESKLLKTDAYGFYPGGSAEFRAKAKSQEADPRSYLQFSRALCRLLSQSDAAWGDALNHVLSSGDQNSAAALRALLAATVQRDNASALAWAKTIQQNDHLLNERFRQFLLANGQARDPDTYARWLDSINAAYRTDDILGNTELASFKEFLVQFMASPGGWDAITLRLSVESVDIPYTIRSVMIAYCESQQDEFWNLYSVACATNGLSVATLKAHMIDFANNTDLPRFLLDEIANQNQLAADAVDPIWEKLLRNDGPLVHRIQKDMEDGLALSNQFALATLALDDTLARKDYWEMAAPIAARTIGNGDPSDPTLQERFRERLTTEADKLVPAFSEMFQNPKLQERWRQSLLNAVRFTSKAYILAALIRTDFDLSKQWADSIYELVTRDPMILRYMLESLSSRKLGNPRWTKNVDGMLGSLMNILVSDRVLVEQLIVDKNRAFRMDLRDMVAEIFGGAIAQEWH